MSWQGDQYTASDGRTYALSSELIRGEGRWYSLAPLNPRRRFGGIFETDWPYDGSYDKRTAKRRIERYAEEQARG